MPKTSGARSGSDPAPRAVCPTPRAAAECRRRWPRPRRRWRAPPLDAGALVTQDGADDAVAVPQQPDGEGLGAQLEAVGVLAVGQRAEDDVRAAPPQRPVGAGSAATGSGRTVRPSPANSAPTRSRIATAWGDSPNALPVTCSSRDASSSRSSRSGRKAIRSLPTGRGGTGPVHALPPTQAEPRRRAGRPSPGRVGRRGRCRSVGDRAFGCRAAGQRGDAGGVLAGPAMPRGPGSARPGRRCSWRSCRAASTPGGRPRP